MKKRTRKLIENITTAIKYYYPFLSEMEQKEMFDNFLYRSLSEALMGDEPAVVKAAADKVLSSSKFNPTTGKILNPIGAIATTAQTDPLVKKVASSSHLKGRLRNYLDPKS